MTETQPARQPSRSETGGADGRRTLWHWAAADQPPHYTAVIAHGINEHARRYDHVAAALLADGAEVWAPDHAGHGLSDGERALVADLDVLVADVKSVLDRARAAAPGTPLVLIGHSLGGLIAIRYLQTHPGTVDAAILSGPFLGNPGLTGLIDFDPIPEVPIDPEALSRDPQVGAAYAADPLIHHGGFHRETIQAVVDALAAVDAGPGFGDLPVLWIHGEDDPIALFGMAAERLDRLRGTGFRSISYPGARHEVFNETNQDQVLADVVAMIGETLEAAADGTRA